MRAHSSISALREPIRAFPDSTLYLPTPGADQAPGTAISQPRRSGRRGRHGHPSLPEPSACLGREPARGPDWHETQQSRPTVVRARGLRRGTHRRRPLAPQVPLKDPGLVTAALLRCPVAQTCTSSPPSSSGSELRAPELESGGCGVSAGRDSRATSILREG